MNDNSTKNHMRLQHNQMPTKQTYFAYKVLENEEDCQVQFNDLFKYSAIVLRQQVKRTISELYKVRGRYNWLALMSVLPLGYTLPEI